MLDYQAEIEWSTRQRPLTAADRYDIANRRVGAELGPDGQARPVRNQILETLLLLLQTVMEKLVMKRRRVRMAEMRKSDSM